jgi:hypothetical protein
MLQRLCRLVVALWAGALWMTGLTASVIFNTLPDKQVAGNLAGHLFSIVSYIGIASAFYLLVYQLLTFGRGAFNTIIFKIVFTMLVLILIGHFGIQALLQSFKNQALPLDVMKSAFASQFKMWHGVAGMVYVVESLLAAAMVIHIK